MSHRFELQQDSYLCPVRVDPVCLDTLALALYKVLWAGPDLPLPLHAVAHVDFCRVVAGGQGARDVLLGNARTTRN